LPTNSDRLPNCFHPFYRCLLVCICLRTMNCIINSSCNQLHHQFVMYYLQLYPVDDPNSQYHNNAKNGPSKIIHKVEQNLKMVPSSPHCFYLFCNLLCVSLKETTFSYSSHVSQSPADPVRVRAGEFGIKLC
jgi:hypothetical protein